MNPAKICPYLTVKKDQLFHRDFDDVGGGKVRGERGLGAFLRFIGPERAEIVMLIMNWAEIDEKSMPIGEMGRDNKMSPVNKTLILNDKEDRGVNNENTALKLRNNGRYSGLVILLPGF